MFSHQRDFRNFNCYAGTEPEMDDLADNLPLNMIKDRKLKLPWWPYIIIVMLCRFGGDNSEEEDSATVCDRL